MKTIVSALLGIVLCLAAASALPQGAPPYKILMIGAFSGPFGTVGKFELAGFQAAADDINERGGVLGRKIEITTEDSAGQGTRAASILQEKIAAGQKPDAIVAGAISNETLALLPVSTQNKIISVAGTGTLVANNPAQYPYNFHAIMNYNKFGAFVGNEFKRRGYKKVGLLTTNDATGQTAGNAEKAGMEKAGLTVQWETFNPGDLDLTAPMQRIADGKPDALLFSVLAPSAPPLILDARFKAGLNVPAYADLLITSDVASLVQPERLKNVYLAHNRVVFYVPPEQRSAAYAAFFQGVKNQGPMEGVLMSPASCWDGLQALALAINQAGSTDPDKVKAAFEDLHQPPPSQRRFMSAHAVRFSPTDHFNTEIGDPDFLIAPIGPRIEGTYRPMAAAK